MSKIDDSIFDDNKNDPNETISELECLRDNLRSRIAELEAEIAEWKKTDNESAIPTGITRRDVKIKSLEAENKELREKLRDGRSLVERKMPSPITMRTELSLWELDAYQWMLKTREAAR